MRRILGLIVLVCPLTDFLQADDSRNMFPSFPTADLAYAHVPDRILTRYGRIGVPHLPEFPDGNNIFIRNFGVSIIHTANNFWMRLHVGVKIRVPGNSQPNSLPVLWPSGIPTLGLAILYVLILRSGPEMFRIPAIPRVSIGAVVANLKSIWDGALENSERNSMRIDPPSGFYFEPSVSSGRKPRCPYPALVRIFVLRNEFKESSYV